MRFGVFDQIYLTPAVHSLAPSQNVFLGGVAQRTSRMRFGSCVYVLPLHHPLRLIEEISILDHLSGGRLEIGVGRGGVMPMRSIELFASEVMPRYAMPSAAARAYTP